MGCGLSKSSDSDSPQQKRRKGSKRRNSVSASDGSSEESAGAEVSADSKKSKLRISVTATPVLNQTKVLSASQLEFFRQLDQKIEQGRDLDLAQAERETRARMELLLRHWDEVVHSRPGTTRPRPNSLASTFSGALLANGAAPRGAPLPPPAEGTEDGRDAPRLERNVRSSRRSMRSARADSTEQEPAAAGERPLDDSQLVTKLIQLGDAYVHDLDADDPDSFVRLGRRSSTYEEPAILEESEAAHARGQYGRSSLALRTMLDDAVR
ncbi:uncharacterized protein LOC119102467 [Pollicipes pollicipes]|uniref:uncharacterized protein LOC119102467 n=1 Tax=Pollicipes pollicipes TaxID=41117 RepID=UPI00188495DC|nr:uncharacterized protein LOC119102467 [Pollicipes pollicipes]XP_037081734.1 uncharacterized protein LOC119102467 [Pollicipes pollicipes]